MPIIPDHRTVHLLEQQLTIHSIGAAMGEIQQVMRGGGDVCIDLSHVSQIDACGIQLLLVARDVAHRDGRSFRLEGEISEEILSFIKQEGFEEQFSMFFGKHDVEMTADINQ